jgi:hypothetical protein
MPITLDILCAMLVGTVSLVEPSRRIEDFRVGAPERLRTIDALNRQRYKLALGHEYAVSQPPIRSLYWRTQQQDVVFHGLIIF